MDAEPKTKPKLGTRIALGALRFGCFLGAGSMLFGLRTPYGALVFVLFWLALDRTLPLKLRHAGTLLLVAWAGFTGYVMSSGTAVDFAVIEIETYVPDTIQPVNSTKVKVHVFPLYLHELRRSRGFHHLRLDGPFQFWIELKDKHFDASTLEISNAVLVGPDGERPIGFARSEPPASLNGWSPYGRNLQAAEHTSFWKQEAAFDLGSPGQQLTLKFKLKRGEDTHEVETPIVFSSAIDSGLINPDAWKRQTAFE